MRLSQILERAVLCRGSRTALIDGEARFSWRSFVDRIARCAGALQQMGLEQDEPVAALGFNSHRYLELQFAAPWAGGVFMPLNVRLAQAELATLFGDSGARFLFYDAQFAQGAADLARRCPALAQLIPFEGCDRAPSYEALLKDARAIEPASRGGDDTACLYYTGGTTGVPKGVMLTHANVMANALNLIAAAGLDETTVHLHASPLFHVAGGARTYAATLAAGTHVILPRFRANEVLDAITRHRVTMIGLVPAMAAPLLEALASGRYDTSSLRQIAYGAAPMPEAILERLLAAFPNTDFYQLYGQTELSPMATILLPSEHRGDKARIRSAGRPVLTAEIRIVGANGDELPPGAVGEIAVRGPMVMKGYWRKPDLTAQALREGWMHTGDAGYRDGCGYLYVVDRIKDMIVTGGENVYSAEVENALSTHPAVRECAVFGIPDDKWGEAVHAVVVPKQGASVRAAELIEHCRSRIATYKCPRSVELRHESLPLSGANKVLKALLRDPYWRGRARLVN